MVTGRVRCGKDWGVFLFMGFLLYRKLSAASKRKCSSLRNFFRGEGEGIAGWKKAKIVWVSFWVNGSTWRSSSGEASWIFCRLPNSRRRAFLLVSPIPGTSSSMVCRPRLPRSFRWYLWQIDAPHRGFFAGSAGRANGWGGGWVFDVRQVDFIRSIPGDFPDPGLYLWQPDGCDPLQAELG